MRNKRGNETPKRLRGQQSCRGACLLIPNLSRLSIIRQYFSPKDLAQFQKQFKLPERPIDKVVGKNVEAFPGAEASLDVEASASVP